MRLCTENHATKHHVLRHAFLNESHVLVTLVTVTSRKSGLQKKRVKVVFVFGWVVSIKPCAQFTKKRYRTAPQHTSISTTTHYLIWLVSHASFCFPNGL